jgi:hypothetical protein
VQRQTKNILGLLLRAHDLYKVVQRLKDTGVLISRSDEGFALFLEDALGAFGGRIDQSDDLETRTKFTIRLAISDELERRIWERLTVQSGRSGSKVPHRILERDEQRGLGHGRRRTKHDVPCADEDDGEVVAAEGGDLVHADEEGWVNAGTTGARGVHCASPGWTTRGVVLAASSAGRHYWDGGGLGARECGV